jgi:hypothetical protein
VSKRLDATSCLLPLPPNAPVDMHCRPWLFFSILSLIHFTNAALSNFTLNDADGNTLLNSLGAAISFTGSGWLAASGSSCNTCPLQPDPTRATHGTYRLGISMQNNDKQIVIEFIGEPTRPHFPAGWLTSPFQVSLSTSNLFFSRV